MKRIYITLLVLILLVSCTTQQPTAPEQPGQQITEPKEETPVGTTPQEAEEPSEETIQIPDDIKEILGKGKTKLSSYSYNYQSPESEQTLEIYIKGNKIKIIPPEVVNLEPGKFYNAIYMDTEAKTAEAYCLGYSNCGKNLGKIANLKYEDTYIETPLDWLAKVTEASIIDKRQVEGRDSFYLETNIGKITLETYYGFLYKIEDGKKGWEFTDAAFNSLADSDVIPE